MNVYRPLESAPASDCSIFLAGPTDRTKPTSWRCHYKGLATPCVGTPTSYLTLRSFLRHHKHPWFDEEEFQSASQAIVPLDV